jgi:hypothetical protein
MALIEPLALLFAGLYGVLVLFYLWERWRRRVIVPSLLLWQSVREDVIRARRFRPDLLFLLQVLVLTCLILGLARPYLRGQDGRQLSGRHIFVLDTTASMQAREGRRTRFDEARDHALKLLRTLPGDAEVMLVSAAHAAEVLVNFTRDHDAVAQALERAAPTDTAGDLAVALASIDGARQRGDVPTQVEVFTDIPRRQLPEAMRDRVTVFQTGESDDNLGIEALQIFQGRFQDYRRARAYVLVENFAHREGHGFLTVRLQDQVVNRNGFTIPARQSKGFLIHGFPGPGRVVAQLEAADALAADNTAFGWIRSVEPVRVLVVSPPSPLLDDLRDLAAGTAALQLTSITPDQFGPGAADAADVVIFHRFVPSSQVVKNALYIYPPAQNPLFPAGADAEGIEVVDWNARHPALRSLRPLAALPLRRARIVSPPPWSQVLLWSRTADREFPLAFAGEEHGRRTACITFDLESERLLSSDNLNLFLFFMNVLGWLAPDGRDARVVRTGSAESFDDLSRAPVRLRDPHGGVSTLPAGQVVVQPLFAGEYQLRSNGTARTLLANFFDPSESDIGRGSKEPPVFPSVPPPRRASEAAEVMRRDYRPWLYCAALVLFLIEWGVARRLAK